MRSNVSRLQQLLLKTKEYKDLFFNASDRDSYFYSKDAEIKREDLIKRYTELKDLIIEANKGIPTISIFNYEGVDVFENAYSSQNDTAAFHCLKVAPEIIIKTIAYFGGKKVKINSEENSKTSNYISDEIINLFSKKNGPFNYKKLISLISELNDNFNKKNTYSVASLIRAILDHVPPLLGEKEFGCVVNNYSWTQTDKNYLKRLSNFKDVAHDALHRQINRNTDLLGMDQIPESICLRRLLQECASRGGDNEFDKSEKVKKVEKTPTKINVSLIEEKNDGWQNYSISSYMGYSFKFVLNVDNFKNEKPDYLTQVLLKAKDSMGKEWVSSHFIFDIDRIAQDTLVKIEPFEVKRIVLAISDQEFSHNPNSHRFKPNLNWDTLVLWVHTKSGQIFKLPIKTGTF